MKRFIAMLIALVMLLAINANAEESANEIVGTWYLSKAVLGDAVLSRTDLEFMGMQATLTLNSDGTSLMSSSNGDSYIGKWRHTNEGYYYREGSSNETEMHLNGNILSLSPDGSGSLTFTREPENIAIPALKPLMETKTTIHYEGEGFDTPEEALACYMAGYKYLDFEQILSAYAWETQIEHYKPEENYKYRKAYSNYFTVRIPPNDKFAKAANINMIRAAETKGIYNSLETYILEGEIQLGTTVPLMNEDEIEAFMDKYNNGKLEKLTHMTNVRFISPDVVTGMRFSDERNRKNFDKSNACYGADEVVNIVGLADVDDETFYCCPTIARYGTKWYVVTITSMTSNMLGLVSDYHGFVCKENLLDMLTK